MVMLVSCYFGFWWRKDEFAFWPEFHFNKYSQDNSKNLVKLRVDTINERHSVSNAEWALCNLYSLPRVINEDETGTIIMLNAKDATYNTKMFRASTNTCRMKGF